MELMKYVKERLSIAFRLPAEHEMEKLAQPACENGIAPVDE